MNGLSGVNGLMTTDEGRETVEYLVRCALADGDTLDEAGSDTASRHVFEGEIGLAPAWKNGACDTLCREYVSGCMLAHVNTAGIHVPIWIVSGNAAMGWGQSPTFPNQEGTFFGDIFLTSNVGQVDAYYCDGTGFDKDVVAGRIGSNQTGAPYRNLYSSKYCKQNSCVPSDSKTDTVADGYKQCVMGTGSHTAWNHPVTVWRGNKAYNASGQVVPGVTADGRTVRYDFESGVNGWTSTNSQLVVSSVSEAGGQTGSKSLKATYGSGASTLRIQGPTGPVAGRGHEGQLLHLPVGDQQADGDEPVREEAGRQRVEGHKPHHQHAQGFVEHRHHHGTGGRDRQPGGRRVQDQRRVHRLPRRGHLVAGGARRRTP